MHEEIDHDVPRLVTRDLSTDLEGLAGKEPEHVCNRVARFVVCWDGNIDPVEGRVGVTKSDNGDVHVGGLGKALMVHSWVAHNDESGLEEPIIKYELIFRNLV